LVGLFTAVTLILSMVGVYGTLSYTVAQRRCEIGIRLALGAICSDILKFVFRQAAVWVISGLIVGVIITVALSFMLLRSAVYGVDSLNPMILFAGIAVVSIASGAACFFPARRATRVDPMDALRCD